MTVTSIFSSVQLTELQYENRRCIKMSGGEILSAGSAQPPLEPGKVRLYGFEYSPYVQRVHMVLIAKNIPHDVKNIDLKNKPDWFLKLNPAGKVPVLDTGDKVLTESLEIVVFLDKNYPGTSLRNTDPEKSAKDREIVEKFEGLRNEFHEAIKNKDYQSPVTIASLSLFRSELEKRGTTFLAEQFRKCKRLKVTTLPRLDKDTQQQQQLCQPEGLQANWKRGMEQQKAVKETMHTLEEHVKFIKSMIEHVK
uniref:GST N-terminal domain-containing protein n=1 Tax=Timema poppense TaxID=170557 RepID=A0A7R9H0P3_TIMPO|nr:unnamed protein product [Timema poppensis]